MSVKLTNAQIVEMVVNLEPLLERRDVLGFVAARNTKILNDALSEYYEFREEKIRKYGKHDVDEDGNELPTISIYPGYENFDKYAEEMQDILNVEQEINLVTTTYDKALGQLSGNEILSLDWLFTE